MKKLVRNVTKISKEDFIHLRTNKTKVCNEVMQDWTKSQKAHEDFIQLIPRDKRNGRAHFGGALLKNISVENNIMLAPFSKRQCVFGSDGLFKSVVIKNNFMFTRGAHFITICGLLSGTIKDNFKSEHEQVQTKLYPLRIAGGLQQPIIYIKSFKEKTMQYKEIKGNWLEAKGSVDLRNERFNDKDYFLENFDLKSFQKEAFKLKSANISVFIRNLRMLAFKYANEVHFNEYRST